MPAISFRPIIPSWYVQDDYYATSPVDAPDVTVPSNTVFGTRPFNGLATQDDMFDKGWTHVSHAAISAGTSPSNAHKFYDAITSANIFSSIPHTITPGEGALGPRRVYTEANVRARANEFAALPVFVGETVENGDWDPQPIYLYWFLDQMRINAVAAGFTAFKSSRNYFWGWRPEIQIGNFWTHADMTGLNALRVLFQYPASEWSTRYPDYYNQIDGFYKDGITNLSLEGWYVRPNFTGTVKPYMEHIHRLMLAQKFLSYKSASGTSGVYLRAEYEVTGYDTWQPVELNDGHLVTKGTMPIDPNELMAIIFTSLWFGKSHPLAIHWHTAPTDNVDPTLVYPNAWGNRHYFIKNDLTEQGPQESTLTVAGFPYYTGSYNLCATGPQTYYDYTYFGFLLWLHCAETIGGTEKFASYRIDGGDWTVLTADNAEPINCAQQNRGIAVTRKSGSWVTVWYWNPAGPNVSQEIEIKDPDSSTTWTGTIFGNKIHLSHFSV